MKLEKDKIGLFNYTLSNAKGEKIDSSDGQPMAYLHGYGNLIPGLEKKLVGKTVGDTFNTTIKAVDAYGEIQEHLIQKEVPITMFQGVDDIEVGMKFEAQAEGGGIHSVEITAKKGDTVTVDGNHPLAGKDLTFDIEITGVREATKEELEHGHAHGAGGHQH
jgi:FKBP-type peptidyl-prolyl cis-trans isomerase SlyD